MFSFLLQLQRSFLTNARKDVTLGRKRKREGEGEEEKRIRNGFRDRFFLPFSFKRHTTMLRLLRFSQVLLLLLLHHRASYIRRESGFVERKQPERERRRRILSSRGGEGNLFGMFGPTLPMEMPGLVRKRIGSSRTESGSRKGERHVPFRYQHHE